MSELSCHSEIVFPAAELSAEVGKLNHRDVRWIFLLKIYKYIYLFKQRLVEAVVVAKKCIA